MFEYALNFLNNLPNDFNLLIEFCTLFSLLFFLCYYFGRSGIYAFMILTIITANLQVLKLVKYSFYPEPIVLGKMIICFTFLSSDLLAECFGKKAAYKGFYLGFATNMGFTLLMLITIGYKPAILTTGVNFHDHLKAIFSVVPGIFLASLAAFITSQILEVNIFIKLKEIWKEKRLPLRYFISIATSSFIDNVIFYSLAFYVFNSLVDLKTLFYSYILGTFIFRLIIIIFSSWIIVFMKAVITSSPKLEELRP